MYIPKRYILVFLAHCGFFIVYALRVNLSVALVAMVNSTYANGGKGHNTSTHHGNGTKEGEFNWDQKQQGVILSSFFYGYLFTNIPGGWLASKYGGKWVLGVGILWTSILTLLSPVAARSSIYLFIALRILMGLGEGVTFPAMHAMIAKWAPPNARSRFVVFSYSGATTGTIITLPVAGILASSNFLGGWPSAFYVFGVFGLLWFLLWAKFVSSSPDDHPSISPFEKKYIKDSQNDSAPNVKKVAVPWFHILTSIRVWAIIIAHFSHNWVWYFVLTDLPSYFKQVLNFSLQENGALSAMPFVIGFVSYIGSGVLADFLIARCLTVTRTRLLMGILAYYPATVFLILVCFVKGEDHALPVALLVLATGFLCLNNAGYNVNHLDIAPRFGGVILGLTNTAGTISGCLTPLVTGYFTDNDPSRENYRKVFFSAAAIAFAGGTFYNIFVTGEQQPWNDLVTPLSKTVPNSEDTGMELDVNLVTGQNTSNDAYESDGINVSTT